MKVFLSFQKHMLVMRRSEIEEQAIGIQIIYKQFSKNNMKTLFLNKISRYLGLRANCETQVDSTNLINNIFL